MVYLGLPVDRVWFTSVSPRLVKGAGAFGAARGPGEKMQINESGSFFVQIQNMWRDVVRVYRFVGFRFPVFPPEVYLIGSSPKSSKRSALRNRSRLTCS